MESIVVTIAHKLGKDEVLRRLKPALGQASQRFPAITVEQEIWNGDRMDFRVKAVGMSVVGNVLVSDETVRIETTLPWLLARLADVVRKTIARNGTVLLEKK